MSDEDIKDIIRGACDGTNNVTVQQLEDALVQQKKFGGIPVFYAKKEVVENLQKKQIRELSEQLEKVRVRRDGWRVRAEQAEAEVARGSRRDRNLHAVLDQADEDRRIVWAALGFQSWAWAVTVAEEATRQRELVRKWKLFAWASTLVYAVVCLKVMVFP